MTALVRERGSGLAVVSEASRVDQQPYAR